MLESVEIEGLNRHAIVKINGEELSPLREDNDESSPTGETGCSRYTFIGDEYVVKIGEIGEALLMIDVQDQKHFAKVVYVDIEQNWLVMERINCVPNAPTTFEDWKLINGLARKYDLGDIGAGSHNWTVDIHGTPVIYDYDFNPARGYSYDGWNEGLDSYMVHDGSCYCSGCEYDRELGVEGVVLWY
jgi:hypothetical protein